MTEIMHQDWYELLVDDCKAIVTEAIFTSNWALLEGYHMLGSRLVLDQDFQKYSHENKDILQRVAKEIKVSTRTIYYAIQFYNKYPDINTLPDGKAATWKKVVSTYLPEKKTEAEELPDYKHECPKCGFRW